MLKSSIVLQQIIISNDVNFAQYNICLSNIKILYQYKDYYLHFQVISIIALIDLLISNIIGVIWEIYYPTKVRNSFNYWLNNCNYR